MGIIYQKMEAGAIEFAMLRDFKRYQNVTKCWRKVDGQWVLRDIAFVENWNEDKLKFLVTCLNSAIEEGGAVYCALEEGKIIGIASLDGEFWGSRKQYLELQCLHTSFEYRGKGVGRELFQKICAEAKSRGAEKIYISGHSAMETQAFYKAMGCVEAMEYNPECVEQEPFDCQLECAVLMTRTSK